MFKLIQAKRERTDMPRGAISEGFLGWHENGYLPHRDQPGLTQFITFRLADALPPELRQEWQDISRIKDPLARRRQFEHYLDRGRGECFLRRPEIAQIVENSILYGHKSRYTLRAWVVMPNHVHVSVRTDGIPMSQILMAWKGFTSKEANAHLGRRGRFWQVGYWDTYVRDADHEARVRRYIESNPVKAGLVRTAADWCWSSARHRDADGVLHVPHGHTPDGAKVDPRTGDQAH